MVVENEIARDIVDTAYQVHVNMGPGLLESIYEAVLSHELAERGHVVQRQAWLPIVYKGMYFEEGFRADLVIDDAVIVELKSVERLERAHSKQLLTYLRLASKRLGLLINFGDAYFKGAVKRVVDRLPEQ